MKKYFIHYWSGANDLYLLNDGRFGDAKNYDNVWLFDTQDEVNEVYDVLGEAAPDMKGWRRVNGELLYTNFTFQCRGCEALDAEERHDAYGITTGRWCNKCYESDKYPYRKDRYEHGEFGERLGQERIYDDDPF